MTHLIWQPGPWGPDLGRSMDGNELRAMNDRRIAERTAAQKQHTEAPTSPRKRRPGKPQPDAVGTPAVTTQVG